MGACYRCGRYGHFEAQCFAHTTKRGYVIDDSDEFSENDEEQEIERCARCFRFGHLTSSCYANTTSTGQPLNKQPRLQESETAQTSKSSALSRKEGVYVLQGEGSQVFYVGKSSNIAARVEQHRTGDGGAAFSGLMGRFTVVAPVTTGTVDDMESWERNETLQRMLTYGIDKVRGWMFTSVHLSDKQKEEAFRQICEKFDLCRQCGRASHFASECYASSKEAWAL